MAGREVDLAELADLGRTSDSRYTTRAERFEIGGTIGESPRCKGVWEAEGGESGERFKRIWINADRKIREEWDTGFVRHGTEIDHLDNWPLLSPRWFTEDPDLAVVGVCEVAARPGIALTAGQNPGSMLVPGADRCTSVIDQERGIVLRLEALLGDEPLMVEEFVEVVFDEALDPALFVRA